jgi:hypothetical protein
MERYAIGHGRKKTATPVIGDENERDGPKT